MDDIERARRILADPTGLMLPGNLGKVLLARIDALEAHVEELHEKIDPDLDCACSYEEAGHICAAHSPALKRAEARIADLEASIAAAAEARVAEASRPALDRALDKLGYALDKARNGE